MHSPNAEPRAREREKEGENKRGKERTERESRNSGTLSDRWKRNERIERGEARTRRLSRCLVCRIFSIPAASNVKLALLTCARTALHVPPAMFLPSSILSLSFDSSLCLLLSPPPPPLRSASTLVLLPAWRPILWKYRNGMA